MKGKIWKMAGLLSIAIFMLSMAASAHAASLTTTLTTGSSPIGVVYDPNKNEIFVSNYDGDDVQVFSDSTNQQVADISMPSAPYDLAYDSSTNEIWVAGALGAYAISDATNQIVASATNIITDWNGLTEIACDPGTGEVFVSYTASDVPASPYIQVISENSNTIIANVTRVSDGGQAATTGMVDDSAKNEIFATAYNGVNTAGVYVISAKTNTVTTTISVSGTPDYLAYDSGKGEIFVGSESTESPYGNLIQVISDSTNKVVATIQFTASDPTLGPMAYNPAKGEIYVNSGISTTVGIISDSTNKFVGAVNTNGVAGSACGIAYDSGTGTVYAISNIGTPGSIAVISDSSGSTGTVTSTSTPSTSTGTVTSASPTATPSPKVPEFSNTALVVVVAAMGAIALFTVAAARKKQHLSIQK